MKTRVLIISVLAFAAFSCEENEMKPEIDFHELGYENSRTAVAGEELHMDVEIVAENRIDRIELEIHSEEEHDHKGSYITAEGDHWELDTVFTRFSGLKNTEFHEHIDVPLFAEPGMYHFHFAVIDQEGYQTVYEDEVEILAPEGSVK